MEANEPVQQIHVGDISNVPGNVAIGHHINQQQVVSGELDLADQIQRLVDQIRAQLAQVAELPGRLDGEEALAEIDETLADGPGPSRPRRMDRPLEKLQRTLDGVTRFATPLAQLAAAIEQLLQAKP